MSIVSAFDRNTPIARDYAQFAVVWTREDCAKLEASGFLNYRYELIEGVILKKMGQYLPHARTVTKAISWLLGQFGEEQVLTQTSILVAESDNRTNQPEPDIFLLNKPSGVIQTSQPRPEDIQLIVEVSDTTLDYDLGTKAGLYARANIPEYWVLSVDERKLYIHRNPISGTYTRAMFSETEMVSPQHAPNATIRVFDLLAPLASS